MNQLELSEIQGIVTSGFAHSPHGCFLFLEIENPALARNWLGEIIPFIDTSARRLKGSPKPAKFVQIGFSPSGLAKFGLGLDSIQTFPREFTLGMANAERSKALGDTGDSAPENWEVGGPKTPDVHILLMLYTTSSQKMEEALKTHITDPAANGLKEVFRQDSYRASPFEPFGFRDGISQPAIEGVNGHVLPGQSVLKAGEFVIGYENEYGQSGAMPTVPTHLDTGNHLAPEGDARAFGRNGTFVVYRKLVQDVQGFWKFIEDQTRKPDGSIDEYAKELLAAKFVGRWRSGAPLTLTPDKDDPELGKDPQRNNDFLFMPKDPDGLFCPVGSHVRRGNPRDTQQPNPSRSMTITNRHRILRRGRPFKDGDKIGLLFIALNADIQRQFEFIQQSWVNNEKFNGLYDNKDPIMGNQNETPSGKGSMTIQGCPVRKRIQGIPRFVSVRGGGYFFLPSISALKFLSKLH